MGVEQIFPQRLLDELSAWMQTHQIKKLTINSDLAMSPLKLEATQFWQMVATDSAKPTNGKLISST